jgi:DNA-binding MarR family transcriptional regulator
LQESIYLLEYSTGIRPYVLEWFNEVFLKEYNEKINKAATKGGNPTEARINLTTRELADAKQQKMSSKQILENYIDPLVNAGYIDKVENEKDRRSYLFYPVINAKQKKLFDVNKSNNLSQQNTISIADSSTYPDRNHLISKIQEVLKYSSQIHKITKLENQEGKEITVEELVDQYYKDPDRYFEADRDKSSNSTDGGTATATAISKTSIQALEDKNKIESVSDEHSLEGKNGANSQQVAEVDVKSIQNQDKVSTELFDKCESNNFLIFKCYYCNYGTDVGREYESHVVLKHPGKLAYPSEIDLQVMGIKKLGVDSHAQTAN